MRRKRSCLTCDRCSKECIFGIDYYMVTDYVWKVEAGLPSNDCMLCIACLEAQLKRKLVLADFINAPVNEALRIKYARTSEAT